MSTSRMVLSERSESKGVYFVYILRTASNTLYIGVTQALDERIDAHHRGRGAEWTRAHPGAEVVYSESYPTLGLARKREIQLKKWSRDKKEALIAGDVAMLKNLTRCHSTRPKASLTTALRAAKQINSKCAGNEHESNGPERTQ